MTVRVRDHVITPHPASPVTPQTFFAMCLENYADAESVVVSIIDDKGNHRAFETIMKTGDLTFHKYCIDEHLREAINRR